MAINQIKSINSLSELAELKKNQQVNNSDISDNPFKSMFENAINDVKETTEVWNDEVYKLTTGQTDNLHDVMIASTKATMSVELLVQLRNKALDAYNQVMNMNI